MSYAIGTLIYGTYITQELSDLAREATDLGHEEGHPLYEYLAEDGYVFEGFEALYHSSGEYTPGYLGKELFDFDECVCAMNLAELMGHSVSEEEKRSIEKAVQELPEEIRKLCPPIDYWIVWSSS